MFYVVGYEHKNVSVRYRCATPELALKKLREFQRFRRANIKIKHPDGRALTEDELYRAIQQCERGNVTVSE